MTSNQPSTYREKEDASVVDLTLRTQMLGICRDDRDRAFGKQLHNNCGEHQTHEDWENYAVDEFGRRVRTGGKYQSASKGVQSNGGKMRFHGYNTDKSNRFEREDKGVVDTSRSEASRNGINMNTIGRPASGHRQAVQTSSSSTRTIQSNEHIRLGWQNGARTNPHNDVKTNHPVQGTHIIRSEQPQWNSGGERLLLLWNLSPNETEQICDKCKRGDSPVQNFLRRADIQGMFCIERDTLVFVAKGHIRPRSRDGLKRLFRQRSKLGFLDWLGGAKGWRFEEFGSGQDLFKWSKDFVIVFNSLQDVFKLLAPKNQLYLPGTNNELVWKKQTNLKACVADIRVWLETLPRNRGLDDLFTNSNDGPHSLLHWAHHHPQSKRHPQTIVSRDSMTELVNGIVQVFCQELRPNDKEGNTKDQVGKYQLGTVWFQAQLEKRQNDWKTTSFIEWNKEKMKALLNGEERFMFA